MQMIRKTYGLIEENLTALLVVTPLINIVSWWILLTLHWLTGKFGYLLASFFCFLGLLILTCMIALNREIKFSVRTAFNLLISAGLFYIVYLDIQILILTMINHGFIPCPFGPSCP